MNERLKGQISSKNRRVARERHETQERAEKLAERHARRTAKREAGIVSKDSPPLSTPIQQRESFPANQLPGGGLSENIPIIPTPPPTPTKPHPSEVEPSSH